MLPGFTLLEQGARWDDDNDFEWTHLWFMDRENVLKLSYPRFGRDLEVQHEPGHLGGQQARA